jgi:hypothetical protein
MDGEAYVMGFGGGMGWRHYVWGEDKKGSKITRVLILRVLAYGRPYASRGRTPTPSGCSNSTTKPPIRPVTVALTSGSRTSWRCA